MPKMKPASDAWMRSFDRATADVPGVERRKMFGYPATFVKGNMAAGLHEVGLVLRLNADDQKALLAKGGRPFEPMPGRVMRGFVVAPTAMADRPAELKKWLERSYVFAGSLPAKKARRKK